MEVEQKLARLLAEIRTNREKMDSFQEKIDANQETLARMKAKTDII
jgi:hypothetical protein